MPDFLLIKCVLARRQGLYLALQVLQESLSRSSLPRGCN
jgi:hypothetical protein